jgi:peptidyl-prolyl cis-trans isomerase B (cyclophilin B)
MKSLLSLVIVTNLVSISFSQTTYPNVVFETNYGTLVFQLYDETPLHCENFTKLVKEGYYNNQLFHRVIKNFMIQAGDPNSKTAEPDQFLGNGGPDYTIPAEFVSEYYHKRGALAAARQPDRINPQKRSSGSQFYVVQGRIFSKNELDVMVERGIHIPFTSDQIEAYCTLGGSPHLDYEYTVFGQLIQGFNVLNTISNLPVDKNDRPLNDVLIIKAYVSK